MSSPDLAITIAITWRQMQDGFVLYPAEGNDTFCRRQTHTRCLMLNLSSWQIELPHLIERIGAGFKGNGVRVYPTKLTAKSGKKPIPIGLVRF